MSNRRTKRRIRAALEAATPGPWETYPAYGHLGVGQFVDEPGNGPMLFIETGGVTYAHNDADAHLIANAPTWLAELLAENERLQEGARSFAAALGYGDGHTEPSATLAELVDPLAEAMSSARDHDECPITCELCGERLAVTRCPQCHGSGCLPNPQLAYLECDTCAGAGRIHTGCAEKSYADLVQILGRVREIAEHYDGRAYSNPAGAILRALGPR